MNTSITITEYDDTHTFSGLPAPEGWYIEDRQQNGLKWRRTRGQAISVIESIATKSDGHRWLHVSVGKPNKKIPTYEDVAEMRRLFIGEERECYMIFPPRARYVNVNPVLHLFSCLDVPSGEVLPHMEGEVEIRAYTEIMGTGIGVPGKKVTVKSI